MNTHTPGPWQWHIGRGANPRLHIQTSAGYQVASTPEINKYETREADARLIAASPDLLAALQDAEFLLRKAAAFPQDAWSMADSFKRSAEDARAAIARAIGEKS